MPTIRAVFPITLRFEVEISRDFYQNVKYQLAKSLSETLSEMDDEAAIDYLKEAIIEVGEGQPVSPQADAP